MSTANIYGFPNAKADAPRNAFDMSFDTLFNSPAGMLLPAYVEDVKAGDRLKLSAKNFTRTRAVNTAAYMSFSEKVDFFFVPYRLLWSAYNQWRLGNTQARSSTSLMKVASLSHLPHAEWGNLVSYYSQLDTALSASTPSVPTGWFSTTKFSFSLRLLDLLGYGLPYAASLTSSRDGDGFYNALQAHFGTFATNYLFNYFRLAAYQCIYMYSYRNEDFESLDPSYYNADSLFVSKSSYSTGSLIPVANNSSGTNNYDLNQSTPYSLYHGLSTTSSSSTLNANRLTFDKLFTPRFKNWRKDLFTSIKPTNGILPASYTDSSGSNVVVIPPVNGSDFNTYPGSSHVGSVPTSTSQKDYIPAVTGTPVTMDDVRKLSSLDKFTRLAIYADKNYSSLYEALFGVKVDEPDVPRYLGTFSSDIKISEIVSTAAGSDASGIDPESESPSTSVLGELAGKGVGTGESRVFDDTFKEDGIVMGIHYIMPYNYYNPYRYNPFTVKTTKYDYYYPSFDGLGLSPVFVGERAFRTASGVQFSSYASVLGYNTRYHEYKQRVNDVHGTFAPGQSDEWWTLTINDITTTSGPQMFKISPQVTDPIFGSKWDSSPATDPFMCFFSFNVTKVSNMEAIGVPNA